MHAKPVAYHANLRAITHAAERLRAAALAMRWPRATALPMHGLRAAALAASLLLGATAAGAASFDCAKARTKLNRMICADPALSALDSLVWDTYGARIASASVTQYAHLRERHALWRRQRGLFDRTIDALKDDYQQHLAWLTHPLLALEGRYEHDEDLAIQVEVDVGAPARVSVQGHVKTAGLVRHTFGWVPSGAASDTASRAPSQTNPVLGRDIAAEARSAIAVSKGLTTFAPAFIGGPPGPVQDCTITLQFGSDELWLTTGGLCGAAFSGHYRRRVSATAWGGQ